MILFSLHKNHLVRRKNSVEIMIPENQAYFTKRKADTSATRTARVLHERHYCDASENFDFDNDTSENIFSPLYQREKFHSKNSLLEMPRFHAKMRLKSAPQKLNFVMAKAISKSYKPDCSCKCPCGFSHSYA